MRRACLLKLGKPSAERGDLGPPAIGSGGVELTVLVVDAAEDRLEAVVIADRDGIELVIMAAGAADREAEETLACIDENVVEGVLPGEPFRGVVGADLSREENRGGDEKPGGGVVPVGIAGELTADEGVVGHVGVEGGHDPVAVGPGIGPFGIHLVAVGVGIPDDVEPVLGHPFAVSRRGEETVGDALDSAWRTIGEEAVDLLRRRGKPDEVQRDAPQPGKAIGLRGGSESLGVEPGEDEAVDVVVWPGAVAHRRRGRGDDSAEGPVVAPVDEARPVDPIWPEGTGIDPGGQKRNFVGREGGFGSVGRWHPHPRLVTARKADERALSRLPRLDRRPVAIPTGEGPRAEVEAQSALGLLPGVAGHTGAVEERADVADEVRWVGKGPGSAPEHHRGTRDEAEE